MAWKDRQRRDRATVDGSILERQLRAVWARMSPERRAAFLAELGERRFERGVTRTPAWLAMPGHEPEPAAPQQVSVFAETVAALGGCPLTAEDHASAAAGGAHAVTSPTAILPIVAAPWGER